MGVEFVYFVQKNTLNRRTRTLKIEAFNESFANRVIINENCMYSVHPENTNWTCFEQTASLDIKSFFGFESTVEKIAMKQYSLNIQKGKEIIEHFVSELKSEGIIFIPPFKPDKFVLPSLEVTADAAVEEEARVRTSSGESRDLALGASASHLPHKEAESSRNKLEADYIQRCLGELTPFQESRLVQLRKWVAELQKGKTPSDPTLLRFLRARDFHIEKAREMISQSLLWRKKHQVDKILSEYEMPEVVKEYFPGGWHHHDKLGRPMYLLRLGQMDVKGLIKSIGEEGLLKLTLHVCEEGLRLTDEATQMQGKPISTWSLLVDLEGLNMRHLWRPGIKTLLRIIEIVEANYPETMGRVLVIRAPRVFPILWTLVSTFIDEQTRAKFLFYGGNDYQATGGLVDYMPEQNIPDFLGGECRAAVREGGLIPKSMYLSEEEQEREMPLTENSIYHSVSLNRGQVHEVLILNEDRGGVICWDFDVMKTDVTFTVYRTRVPIVNKEPPPSPTGALHLIENLNPLAEDPEHRSVIEKGWKEGQEYFKVEPTLVCHDGESIQGSHVTGHLGTYILQWKYHEPYHHHHGALDIIDSITAVKARVMYYYETLKAADYRGSMTSLHSIQSGFSSLSCHTNKSNNSSCPSR